MRVVVAGGGTLGRRVAGYIRDKHDVVVVEQSEARARALAEEHGLTVIRGDIDEPSVMLEAGVDRADAFVALTGHDEDNLVSCLLAKNEFKVGKVVAVVRNPRNRWLYNRSWGVDVALDSGAIVARIIEEEATLKDLVHLLDLREGQFTVTSMEITAGGWAGRTVASLRMPESCYAAAVLRSSAVLIPVADVVLEAGDALLIITAPGGECHLDEVG